MCQKILSRIILLALNVVYFLAAVAILTIGSLSLSGSPVILDMLSLIEDTALLDKILDVQALTVAASAYLVTLGSLAVILAFIGAFTALRRRGCLNMFFTISKFVIILFNLALIMYNSIVPYHGKDTVQNLLLENLKDNYNQTKIQDGSVILPEANTSANFWATMEFEQACCAAGGYEDYPDVMVEWEKRNIGVVNNVNISSTCCMQIQQYYVPENESQFVNHAGCLASPPNYANPRGCIDYVMSLIINYRQVYILVAASFIALEVLILALTIRVHRKDRGVDII